MGSELIRLLRGGLVYCWIVSKPKGILMDKYKNIFVIIVWIIIPVLVAIFFKSMYPLFGWIPAAVATYLHFQYEEEK